MWCAVFFGKIACHRKTLRWAICKYYPHPTIYLDGGSIFHMMIVDNLCRVEPWKRHTIELSEIQTLTTQALIAHGADDWVAASVARAVRMAEAKGNLICGLYYLESYCKQLVTGRVNGRQCEPVVTVPKSASVHVDAKFGFAQAAFERALPIALETVRETGTCSLAVAHSHTCTSLGIFRGTNRTGGLHCNRPDQRQRGCIAPWRKQSDVGNQSDCHGDPRWSRVVSRFSLTKVHPRLHWVKLPWRHALAKIFHWAGPWMRMAMKPPTPMQR